MWKKEDCIKEYTSKEYAMDNEMKVSLDFEMNVSYLI